MMKFLGITRWIRSELFLKEIEFRSRDEHWARNYLNTSHERLTARLGQDLGNAFWENYSQVLIRYFNEGRLLIRIKSISGSSVLLSQVWKAKRDYTEFLVEALKGIDMKAMLIKNGIESIESEAFITEKKVEKLLESFFRKPHILQFIHSRWRKPNMKVGDPLKQGRSYLPFPNEIGHKSPKEVN